MVEPLKLADLKAHLRLDVADASEDGYLSGLITAARRRCELFMNRSVIGGARQIALDSFPAAEPGTYGRFYDNTVSGLPYRPQRLSIELPGGACASVDQISYQPQSGGAAIEVLTTAFAVDQITVPGRVAPRAGWPAAAAVPGAITIKYTLAPMAGDDLAMVVTAMLLLIAHWYRNRESVAVDVRGTPIELPNSFSFMLEDLRIGGVR